MKLERGTVALVGLDPTKGHEQRGTRPCVLVSDPSVTEAQRFPIVCVVPVTGTRGEGALYPRLEAGASGLRQESWALVDQLRAMDNRRVLRVYGQLDDEEIHGLDEGLRLFLGLT